MNKFLYALSLLFAVSLTGCDSTSTNTAESTTVTDTQQQTKEASTTIHAAEYISPLPDDAPVITLGTESNYQPFEFKNEYGNVVGFDIDLVRAIGEKQGFKVEVHNDTWKNLFDNLENGKHDMIAAGLGENKERREKFEVSNTYIDTSPILAYMDKSFELTSTEDLKSIKIGVVTDSNDGNYLAEKFETGGIEKYKTLFLAIQAMTKGEVNGVVADKAVLTFTLATLGIDASFFEYGLNENESAIIFLTGKGNTELLNKLNQGIKDVQNDGTYAKLTEKWFGEDLTESLTKQQKKLGEK